MPEQNDRSFWIFNALVSTAAVGFLGWLLLLREGGGVAAELSFMPAVNAALADIGERLGSEDSLVVLPEGVMLNSLARLPNSTGHINFMPPELIFFPEEMILEELEANRPEQKS